MPSYLLASDFDGTIARTFEKSPNGIGVKEAYLLSIKDVLGETGVGVYNRIGGLQNMAPAELVLAILAEGPKAELITNAKVFFGKASETLGGVVPQGKGVPLIWDESEPDKVVTEMLVREKLIYLLQQIGTRFPDGQAWPKPCEGFINFWKSIQELNFQEDIHLETAVISSGHDEFIKRTFQLWGLNQPDYLVTEDDIRGVRYPKEMTRRAKPGQLQLAMAHREWLKRQKLDGVHFRLETVRQTRERMMYFGDDTKKDGLLAKGAGIPFGLIKNGGAYSISPAERVITFGDWQNIAQALQDHSKLLREGRPLSEIFLSAKNGIEAPTFTVGHEHVR